MSFADLAGSTTLGAVSRAMAAADNTEGVDAPAGASSPYSTPLGAVFQGQLGSGDTDWVEVTLEAGESYVFLSWGTGGQAAGIDDTVLTLYAGDGREIASNDDILPTYGNLFSAITYEAEAEGTHWLGVSGFDGEAGDYRVLAASDTFDAELAAIYMTEVDWGAPTTLRFDLDATRTLTVNLTALTGEGQQLARWALEAWEVAAGITFTEVRGSADITFDDDRSGAFAGPSSYLVNSGLNAYSDVNVGTEWIERYGSDYGSYGYQTYLHEIGHALGLGHAGPYEGVATYGVDNLFANDSTQLTVMSYFDPDDNPEVAGEDVNILTPMPADVLAIQSLYGTATAYSGDTTWGANSNVGGMLGQAFAILYDGASPGQIAWADEDVAYTVFDSGGTDTLDFSTATEHQRIDMRAGAASDVGGVDGGLVIAVGTVIENARGGSGDDTIAGNDADNRLEGGRGNDRVRGGAGIDTAVLGVALSSVTATSTEDGIRIVSSEGTDLFSSIERFAFSDGVVTAAELLSGFGAGVEPDETPVTTGDPVVENDTPAPTESSDPDTTEDEPVQLADDSGAGASGSSGGGTPSEPGDDVDEGTDPSGTDVVDSPSETAPEPDATAGVLRAGGAGDDTLTGTDFDDTIAGQQGADMLYGLGGADRISASDGDDTVLGGNGDDMIGGGLGNDSIDAGDGDDTVGGGFGNDTVLGGLGDDVVNGGAGDDLIEGGFGNDTSGAGFHDDRVFGGEGDDSLGGGSGRDSIVGGNGNDAIGAGAGDDTVDGGAGHDFLAGGDRHDLIDGGSGNDTINGGSGNDTMTGRGGADVFVFNEMVAGDRDVITDFEVGTDMIRLSGVENAPGSGLAGYLEALDPTDVAGGTVLSWAGHEIRLAGVSAADLTADDFVFV
ncbi:serralysin [Roseivivax marinus]|uniref:M10 family metallopeptidase n=1 Tax=Roseivivax marinus TaxID=1379903 RepID=UPI0008B96786|nr:M10 family metallopeptidase C-terminal domain-containing protein [Roseivivax marinus]SEL72048.1 serralysin [Roseivivax marinus]